MSFFSISNLAQVIKNGSFEESPMDPPDNFLVLNTGSTAILHWTVGEGAGIDYVTGYWNSSNGKRSIDLNALDIGSISQVISTEIGKRYVVLFDFAGNPNCNKINPIKRIRVSAANVQASYSFDIQGKSNDNMGWKTDSFTFMATATTTILTFSSTVEGNCGPAIDNVRMSSDYDCNGVHSGVALMDDCGVCLEASDPEFNKSCNLDIYIPTAFSPNGDPLNSRFALSKSEDLRAMVSNYAIYNRWGELIYSAENFEFSNTVMWWDGKYKNNLVQIGLYMYQITVEYSSGKKKTFRGSVTRM